jgi:hypothetical protein
MWAGTERNGVAQLGSVLGRKPGAGSTSAQPPSPVSNLSSKELQYHAVSSTAACRIQNFAEVRPLISKDFEIGETHFAFRVCKSHS